MQNLRAPFAPPCRHVFAHLPIHRRLQTIFDRERASFDKEVTFERGQTGNPAKCFDKTCVPLRVNIRVRDLDLGRTQQIALHLVALKIGMIEAHRHGAEKSVEIDELMARRRII